MKWVFVISILMGMMKVLGNVAYVKLVLKAELTGLTNLDSFFIFMLYLD